LQQLATAGSWNTVDLIQIQFASVIHFITVMSQLGNDTKNIFKTALDLLVIDLIDCLLD
jgi:hypothetical protein